MLPSRLIRHFREAADQLLKEITHFDIADRIRVQIDIAKTLKHVPKDAAVLEALELFCEPKFVEKNVTDIWREFRDVVE